MKKLILAGVIALLSCFIAPAEAATVVSCHPDAPCTVRQLPGGPFSGGVPVGRHHHPMHPVHPVHPIFPGRPFTGTFG